MSVQTVLTEGCQVWLQNPRLVEGIHQKFMEEFTTAMIWKNESSVFLSHSNLLE